MPIRKYGRGIKASVFVALLFRLAGLVQASADSGEEASWSQFRGPNGQGVAPSARIPVYFGPETNLLWKCEVPAGHSSPVLWGNGLFLTGMEGKDGQELVTEGFRRDQGKLLWKEVLHPDSRAGFHPLNNPASSTPAVDAQHVYAYFGTYGLVCYDHAGTRIWERRLDTPQSKYGVATSPILYQNTLILVLDGDNGASRVMAVEKDTGKAVWEQARALFRAGWSTPSVFCHNGIEELVVLGSKRLTAYNPRTGEELWWAGGFPDETVGIPVIGEGLIFASAAALGGRGDEQFDAAATWKMTVREFDRNHDNQIQKEEMTEGFAFIQRPELPRDNPGYGLPVGDMDALLRMFDHDHNGVITEDEWMSTMAGFTAASHPTLVAIRPGARGDARKSHLAWEGQRGIPEAPSPVYAQGRLYLLRDGGLLTCLKAATGTELFRERIGAPGQYIASPVIAGDKVVTASTAGIITVIQMGDELNVLARNHFNERIFATPAIADNKLYVRTGRHLYALGN